MEVGGGERRRPNSWEKSPDRAKVGYMQRSRPSTSIASKKAQIIYYLTRNGQLEHPHFMELPHLPNQQIRLKDVMDRLTVLRGRGVPSLFSWSCKRSYKNGYVWNDLSEDDMISPADGAEYVLKGSEIIHGLSERLQQLQVSARRPKPLSITQSGRYQLRAPVEEEVEEDDDKGGNHSCCSRGVSTDDIEQVEKALDDASPPSSSSSEKLTTVAAAVSRRFEDGDSETEPCRNSVFMQLIACGSAVVKGRSSGRLLKGVTAFSPTSSCPSSGSIVKESCREPPEPAHKKSPSYNEESFASVGGGDDGDRSSKLGTAEGGPEAVEERGGARGKCIPDTGKKRSSCKQ